MGSFYASCGGTLMQKYPPKTEGITNKIYKKYVVGGLQVDYEPQNIIEARGSGILVKIYQKWTFFHPKPGGLAGRSSVRDHHTVQLFQTCGFFFHLFILLCFHTDPISREKEKNNTSSYKLWSFLCVCERLKCGAMVQFTNRTLGQHSYMREEGESRRPAKIRKVDNVYSLWILWELLEIARFS